MVMFNPPHPGEGLKDDLEALGLSVPKAAAALKISRSQLNRVVSTKSAITPELAIRLEAVIGSTADHWLRLQAAYDLAQVRKRQDDLTKGLERVAM
jgi:addiction module HigA family antidote